MIGITKIIILSKRNKSNQLGRVAAWSSRDLCGTQLESPHKTGKRYWNNISVLLLHILFRLFCEQTVNQKNNNFWGTIFWVKFFGQNHPQGFIQSVHFHMFIFSWICQIESLFGSDLDLGISKINVKNKVLDLEHLSSSWVKSVLKTLQECSNEKKIKCAHQKRFRLWS